MGRGCHPLESRGWWYRPHIPMRGEEACDGVHAGVCQDEVVGWLLVGISQLSWWGVAIVVFSVHTGRWAMFAVACYECVGPERMLDEGMLVDVVMQWWRHPHIPTKGEALGGLSRFPLPPAIVVNHAQTSLPERRVVGWAVMACHGRVVVGSEEAVEVVDTRETGGRHDPGRSWSLAYRRSGGVPLLRDVDGVKRETTR